MPYDKGDFTQQGYDGKVAGGLLLNNKRDVDVLVSTNEEDSTLDLVAVTIEDHLNDLKYAFFGENLEAGEVYEIGAGGGGVSYKKLTVHFVNTSESPCNVLPNPVDFVNDELCIITNSSVPANGTADLDFLYVYDEGDYCVAFQTNIISSSDAVNCTYEPYLVTITDPTQDASITFTVGGID